MGGLRESGPIDVGHKAERHPATCEAPERMKGHFRAEIRSADADVDDILDALSGVAFPFSGPHAVRKSRHLIENFMNLRNNINAIDLEYGAFGAPGEQRGARSAFR